MMVNYMNSCFIFQGYTALHIAMQFGRKEISELLIDVYRK